MTGMVDCWESMYCIEDWSPSNVSWPHIINISISHYLVSLYLIRPGHRDIENVAQQS